ncbi:hypothetical protein B2J93_5744 [Marssonina coronariae]|uniref:Uncharacterized protein n=1 Tax=Diplocarpon coronariae TaxID=2795749 RepID=A0A218Z066_9HELO|nr:hypothetical protein B2J93_5744 [Marssonina coronariae]
MTGPGFRDERDGTDRRLVLLKRDPAASEDACILLNAETSGERQPMPSGPHMRSCDLSVSATALDVNKQTHLHQAPDGWRDAGDAAHVIRAWQLATLLVLPNLCKGDSAVHRRLSCQPGGCLAQHDAETGLARRSATMSEPPQRPRMPDASPARDGPPTKRMALSERLHQKRTATTPTTQ